MIVTNYSTLIDEDTTEQFIQKIEAFTGPRTIYGLNTDINVVDILDNVGIDEALICFYAATTDIRPINTRIGIDLIRNHVLPWQQASTGNSSALIDLMYFCEQFLLNQEAIIRRDYCGDIIPNPNLDGTINDFITAIQNIIDGLSLTTSIIPVVVWAVVGPTEEPDDPTWGGRYSYIPGSHSKDPFALDGFGDMSWYVENPISSEIASDAYMAQSNHILADRTINRFYQKLQIFDISTGLDDPPNHANLAAIQLGEAAIEAANQVLYNFPKLNGIAVQIQNGYKEYDINKRLPAFRVIERFRELSQNMIMPLQLLSGTDGQNEALIIQALWARRDVLLRDAAYVQTFDVDLSGGLSLSERQALETDMRAQMVIAAKATAVPILAVYEAALVAITSTNIDTVIRPYLL